MNWEDWKRIQNSMELEGWRLSDEALRNLMSDYKAKGFEELLEKAVQQSHKRGKPVLDEVAAAVREYWLREKA